MKSYETPSDISAYEYCERLGGLNKLMPFGGSKSNATVIGNVEHASFQEGTPVCTRNFQVHLSIILSTYSG